jgi:hypothetical protein
MKKIIFIGLMLISLFSCDSGYKNYKTDKIYLRQLVKVDKVTKEASGSYFLVVGSGSYEERTETKIKLMGKVNGYYRLIEFDFVDVRIKVDNSIKNPYLIIKYQSNNKLTTNEILNNDNWYTTGYVIVCPEKYLPERLLPISL